MKGCGVGDSGDPPPPHHIGEQEKCSIRNRAVPSLFPFIWLFVGTHRTESVSQSGPSQASKQQEEQAESRKKAREEKKRQKRAHIKKMCWTNNLQRKPTKSTPLKPFQKQHLYPPAPARVRSE
jgi:hypothetical protein